MHNPDGNWICIGASDCGISVWIWMYLFCTFYPQLATETKCQWQKTVAQSVKCYHRYTWKNRSKTSYKWFENAKSCKMLRIEYKLAAHVEAYIFIAIALQHSLIIIGVLAIHSKRHGTCKYSKIWAKNHLKWPTKCW